MPLRVITGPMFSGKSEELIRLIRRAEYGRKKFIVCKPELDKRQNSIRHRQLSPDGKIYTCQETAANEIGSREQLDQLIRTKQPDIVFIDEIQFFGDWIADCLTAWLNTWPKLLIYAAGLDQTAWGQAFGPMAELLILADEVTKLTAICFQCGEAANMTYKSSAGQGIIEIGDAEKYEARCRSCWHPPS